MHLKHACLPISPPEQVLKTYRIIPRFPLSCKCIFANRAMREIKGRAAGSGKGATGRVDNRPRLHPAANARCATSGAVIGEASFSIL